MGEFSIWHWIIVLLIVILIFGTKRLRNVGSDLGSAIRQFKASLNPDEDPPPAEPETSKNAAHASNAKPPHDAPSRPPGDA